MKTITVSVERNFHVMNDDKFVMEKISMTADVEDSTPIEVVNKLRELIKTNFKVAYPHVYTYLNFEEVIQVDKELQKDLQEIERETGKRFTNGEIESNIKKVHGASNYEFMQNVIAQSKPEKINKGTIEEQIEASKDLDELDGWKLIAKTNSKLQKVFSQREKELINEAVK